tara:strand:+ start:347 stop:733 length:387 start_codon:yes stop_codon:yes gene_type:complete
MACPTDFLEPIIDLSSDELNYFYSSFGNNLALDKKILEEIGHTIEKEGIIKIIFVISENNRIILDALSNQNLKNLRGKNEIVFIGQNMDKILICKQLEACLSNNKELETSDWKLGYEDDWPVEKAYAL